jgi:pyruvate-formate lyase-activating enzyme
VEPGGVNHACDWCHAPAVKRVTLERAVYSGGELMHHAVHAYACPAHAHLGLADDADNPRPPLASSLRHRRDREAEENQLTIYDLAPPEG